VPPADAPDVIGEHQRNLVRERVEEKRDVVGLSPVKKERVIRVIVDN